jgi:NADPH:quinone reductase-like Zn-dependent oxidoreductase
MKGAIYTQYGASDVLKVVELPKPIPKDNEILIKVKSTTVNSADVRLRKADPWLVRLVFGVFKPKNNILGMVFAGAVEEVGSAVTGFKIGDEVFGINEKKLSCFAQYVVVSSNIAMSIKPKNLNFEESASLVFGGHTALHFLKKAGITKGQKVLIYGASGSVGTAAVQIAKYYGAIVTAVCSTANLEFVKNLGADLVIDYTKQNLLEIKETYDVVYETVDKTRVLDIAKLIKPKGTLILGAVIIKGALEGLCASKQHKIKMIAGVAEVTSKDMEFLAQLAQDNYLKPVIDKIFTLDKIVEANRYVDEGNKKGNVVVELS